MQQSLQHQTGGPFCCHNNSNQLAYLSRDFTALYLVSIVYPITPHPSILTPPCSISLDQAKDVHRSLKVAAGMFLHVKDSLLPKLPASTEKGTDFDPRVVEAYANQSQAEAQEGKYKTCWLEWGQSSVDNYVLQ